MDQNKDFFDFCIILESGLCGSEYKHFFDYPIVSFKGSEYVDQNKHSFDHCVIIWLYDPDYMDQNMHSFFLIFVSFLTFLTAH